MSKKKILDCYRKMYRGMFDKDEKALSEVLNDSFVLVHMTGMKQPREDFIKSVADGTLSYYSAFHQNREVEICGDRVLLIGQSVVNAAVFSGGRHTWRLEQRIKLKKVNQLWKMLKADVSTY